MFHSEVCHQLQYDDQAIYVDSKSDAEEADIGTQERERLIVKIPLGKGKGISKKKLSAPSKKQSTKGGGGNNSGGGSCGSHGGRGRGRGHGCSQTISTSTSSDNNKPSTHGRRRGRSRAQPKNTVTDEYPVPDFKAVVTDAVPPAPQQKGYTPPDNKLAIQLAKYFESRTEIEYDVLLKQMETVPQADIMQILGIKKKTEDSEEKELEEKSIEEIPQLTPDDEKEADDLMASLAQKAKEEALKADAESKQKEENEKDKDKKQKKDNIKKLPIKPCSVQMGTKVPNKSPVKVTDTDSDFVLISSDEGGKKNKKNAGPLNLSLPKNDASESDGASSHGVYFTDSEEFRNLSKPVSER